MTDSRRNDSHLDAAIDRAVRDLMSAEPRAGLRERVLAELTGEPARAAWWPRLAFGSAAVAVAVVMLLVLLNRPAAPPVEETIAIATPPAAAPANRRDPPTPPGAAPPMRVDTPPSRPLARGVVEPDRQVQAASIDTIAPEPMAVERLAPIDPIRIARLEAPPVPEASITPITIERIEITPLTPQR